MKTIIHAMAIALLEKNNPFYSIYRIPAPAKILYCICDTCSTVHVRDREYNTQIVYHIFISSTYILYISMRVYTYIYIQSKITI